MRLDQQITIVLTFLVLFDLTLVVWAFGAPGLWFTVWHGEVYADPAALVRRCGANWAGFLLFQTVALVRWRQAPHWLAVVAGVRLSDIFTDLTTALFAEDLTWAGLILLPAGSLMNVVLGFWLLQAWKTTTGVPSSAA